MIRDLRPSLRDPTARDAINSVEKRPPRTIARRVSEEGGRISYIGSERAVPRLADPISGDDATAQIATLEAEVVRMNLEVTRTYGEAGRRMRQAILDAQRRVAYLHHWREGHPTHDDGAKQVRKQEAREYLIGMGHGEPLYRLYRLFHFYLRNASIAEEHRAFMATVRDILKDADYPTKDPSAGDPLAGYDRMR